MLPEAAGRGQHFQDLGHSSSLYGPPSRQITYNVAPSGELIHVFDCVSAKYKVSVLF